ncbi:hypothetical protein [Bifidobacterium platyrrhinorum]|uniref:hypothetical protein n=1 Tax=Bifidobacterium platyrrhinorum TaxID=2661628 RepID=UPI001CDCD556|nr:hypothetical protein [Bifidobacterium platyrrhinorum]
MATAHEWIAYDFAAQNVLGKLIGKSGHSYRRFSELSSGSMSYNRVRDIELGRRAPVKLSEFLLICDVCNADPVQTLRDIIREAARLQAEAEAREREAQHQVDIDALADRIAAHPEEFDLAANDDPNKENEMTTPRE